MHYYAFISYRRLDEKIAVELQKKLERYRLPSVLCKERGMPRRLKPIFRDKTDIDAGMLIPEIHDKIAESRNLIVLCSTKTPESNYIDEEIAYFAESHPSDYRKHIIPVIISGTPYCGTQDECYPKALRRLFPIDSNPKNDCQLLGANLNEAGIGSKWMKKERAFVMVLSKLLDVTFDSLWKRHKRYLIRSISAKLALASLLIFIPFLTWSYTKPFDMTVTMAEKGSKGIDLPISEGLLTVLVGQDTIRREISTKDSSITVNNIPGTLRGKSTVLTLELFGYFPIDSVFLLQSPLKIDIERNPDCFGHIQFLVRDCFDKILSGAEIEVEGISAFSDDYGMAKLDIPLDKQHKIYRGEVTCNGKTIEISGIYPMQYNSSIVNTVYVK